MKIKKEIKDIIQNEVSECGLACISYIANAYGKRLSLDELRTRYDVSLEGLSFYHLMQIFSHNQMIATGVNIAANALEELQKPAILLWNNSHFVVLKRVNKGSIEVMDPAVGSRVFTNDEIKRFFSGVALEVIPADDFICSDNLDSREKTKKNNTIGAYGFKEFYQGAIKYKSYIFPLALLTILIQITLIVIPKFISLVFDAVIPKNDADLLYLLLYIFGFVYLLNSFGGYLKIILSQRLRRYISQKEGLTTINNLLRMNLKFYQKRFPSDLLRKVKAIDAYPVMFTHGWVDIFINGFFACILTALLIFTSGKLALMTLAIMALMFIIRVLLLPIIMSRQYSAIDAEIRRDNSLLDVIGSISNVKMNQSEYRRIDTWFSHHVELEYNRSSIEKINAIIELSMTTISHIQMLVIMGFGSYSVLAGDMTAGHLIAFVFYVNLIMSNFQTIVENHINIKLASVEIKRLQDVQPDNTTMRNEFKSNLKTKNEIINTLGFDNLTFSYSNLEEPIIKNLSFSIHDGDKIALVGPSGCGKTTILNLLGGLRSPSRGDILVNGISLNRFGIQQYQAQISMVSTDDKIISGTVIDNIIHEAQYHDISLLEECIEKADFGEVIKSLSAGLNTRLGYNGARLSSGQQQRLMFARALYRKPKILLLDEPTSHLDHESRNTIIEMILSLQMSCVIVTHDQILIDKIDNKISLNGED